MSGFPSSLLLSVSWIGDEQTFCHFWAQLYLTVVGVRSGATQLALHRSFREADNVGTRGRDLIPSRDGIFLFCTSPSQGLAPNKLTV
jgi:hypothetical protein